MGALLAKFRKEKTTTEVLENLEERIQQIEKYSLNTQEQKKRIVGNFLAISIGVYVVAFLVFYFVYFPPTWKERLIYFVPLLLFPVVIIFLRMAFTWYFQRKLNKNSMKLSVLRTEKKKILEQVMDKETYKVAVNLLARFGDKTNGNRSLSMTPRPTSGRPNQSIRALPSHSSNQLTATTETRTLGSLMLTPQRQTHSNTGAFGANTLSRQLATTPQLRTGQELRRRTPFPIVNQQDKGVFERIVDVLIGDGPQDRFAMICKDCYAHNGMALKEEFDFATFRCAFCNALNPSRRARPVAPPLPLQMGGTPSRITAGHSSDSAPSSDDEDSDNETIAHEIPAMKTTEASFTDDTKADKPVETEENVDIVEENTKKDNIYKEFSEASKLNEELKKEM